MNSNLRDNSLLTLKVKRTCLNWALKEMNVLIPYLAIHKLSHQRGKGLPTDDFRLDHFVKI